MHIPSSEHSTVSILSYGGSIDDIRKRVLDPLDSELVWPDVQSSLPVPLVVSDSEGSGSELPMVKKRKVAEANCKRAQMKYEPPVELAREMTKEEIAAWRRVRKWNAFSSRALTVSKRDRLTS